MEPCPEGRRKWRRYWRRIRERRRRERERARTRRRRLKREQSRARRRRGKSRRRRRRGRRRRSRRRRQGRRGGGRRPRRRAATDAEPNESVYQVETELQQDENYWRRRSEEPPRPTESNVHEILSSKLFSPRTSPVRDNRGEEGRCFLFSRQWNGDDVCEW